MDSEYIRQNEIHEKYVLNQLDGKEKAEYEAFLKENPQAQKELAETKNLIEGVRAAGKDAMKKEITGQVDELRQSKTDWSILYKAAAVLFILVIVPSVIYYQMIEPQNILTENQAVKKSAPEKNLDTTVKEDEQASQKSEVKQQPQVEEKEPAKPLESPQPKKRTENISEASGAGFESDAITIEKDKSPVYKNEMKDLKTAPAKSIQADALKSEASLSKASLPEQQVTRTIVFSKYKPPVELVLFRTLQKALYPQKLDVHVTEDEEMLSINLAVSPTLFLMKDEQIKIKFNPRNEWLILFTDSVSYKLNLNADPPFAQKIKNN